MNTVIKFFIGFSLFAVPLLAFSQECENDNAALQAMGTVKLTITRSDGSLFTLDAKYANSANTRAAGFQHVCVERIETTLILFEFNSPLQPSFHMNNVVAPLDIAFIEKDGSVESTQRMSTYSILLRDKPLYSPSRPVVAALEAHDGFYAQHKIDTSSRITWMAVESIEE